MNNENQHAILEKIKYFLDNKIMVHVRHKDGYFLNGFFTKEIRKSLFILNEREMGEVLVHVTEIKAVMKYEEKEEDGH